MKHIPKLTILYLYVTNKCNLKCAHCWIDGDIRNENFIDIKILEKTVEKMTNMGLRQVNLTGGEPTLHPKLIEIIEMFYNKNINIYLNTNGTLLNDKMCNEFEKFKSRLYCSVSLDSVNQEVHDIIRGRDGAYNDTIEGIKRLTKRKIPCEIIFTIQKKNKDYLIDVFHEAEVLNATLLRVNFLQYSSGKRVNELKNEEGQMDIEDILFYKDIITNLNKSSKIRVMTNLPFSFYSPSDIIQLKHRVCGIKHAIGILPDASVSLCGVGELNTDLIMGKLEENSIEEIWTNNEIVEYVRREIPNNLMGICGKCNLRNICCGYCVAQNYMDSNNLRGSYNLCEKLYEADKFPKKYLDIKRISNE